MFLVLKQNSQKLNLTTFKKKFPSSEQVTTKSEIDQVMNRVQMRSVLVIVTTIGIFFWSMYLYRQFWNYHNFGSYFWATNFFLITTALASLWKNALFVMRLYKGMYVNS